MAGGSVTGFHQSSAVDGLSRNLGPPLQAVREQGSLAQPPPLGSVRAESIDVGRSFGQPRPKEMFSQYRHVAALAFVV